MEVDDQVKYLKKFFDPPARIRLLSHKTHNDEVASCCQAAKASIHGAVVASAASEGITGVIEYFTANFSWGCLQSKHYCDCFANRNDLYCIGTTCVGLECLGFYKSLSKYKVFDLMVVEFLISDCASVIRTERQYLAEAAQMTTTAERSHSWVLSDTFYHVLIGVVDAQHNLIVCDSDGSMPFLAINNGNAARIQSMRVSPWAGDCQPTRFFSHVNWNGTKIALNQWVDDVNFDNGGTVAEAVKVLERVYEEGHLPALSPSTLIAHCSANSLTSISVDSISCTKLSDPAPILPVVPTVLISGTHMGPNPCPGVGIARALRAALGTKEVRLISVGDAVFSDPVFDAHWPVLELGAAAYLTGPAKTQTQWDIVSELILAQSEASTLDGNPVFFVPGCDTDIELISLGKAALKNALEATPPQGALVSFASAGLKYPLEIDINWSVAQLQTLHGSILCPDAATVALTAKPTIVAASCGPLGAFFEVPEFFILDANSGIAGDTANESVSLMEMRMCADRIGYPVLIKGSKQGALVCPTWQKLRAVITTQGWVKQGAFIQKCMHGWEKCIAFAAFEGRLLGCCLMTKASYTEQSKVWSGDIESVPSDLSDALQVFVAESNWTGGGEIEFIEEIVPSGALSFSRAPPGHSMTHSLFLPRSSAPARTMDKAHCVQANHPGATTVPRRWVVDFNPRFPAWIFASAYSGCNLPALLVAAAVQNHSMLKARAKFTGGTDDTPASTTSSTSVSSEHCVMPAVAAAPTIPRSVSFVRSLIEVPVVHTLHRRHLPSHTGRAQLAQDKGKEGALLLEHTSTYNVLPRSCCRQALQGEYSTFGANEPVRYLANDLRCLTTTTKSLIRADAIERTPRYILCTLTLENTLQRMQKLFEEAAAPSQLPVQLCLSVKTQPHTALIRLAVQAGYFAECIDLAEVYHVVLNGGYSFDQIVLTGPAKWWDIKSTEERGVEVTQWEQVQVETNCTPPRGTAKKLHAIFADSLSDLQDLVERLLDPTNPIDTDVVGIRWMPLGDISSRFGLDSNDVEAVRQAAELVRSLPEKYRLGMHFHHASSVLGGERWFGLAQAFCVFSGEFALLCGRPVATMDFGGGFEAYFLESAYAQEKLRDLFQKVHQICRQPATGLPPTVQLELGKCISEPAGGVLTRILAIRERRSSTTQRDGEDGQQGTARAVIVDTTVADLSTRSTRPVFWVKKPGKSCISTSKIECVALPGGPVEIWGRTCMEWDKVFGSFALPAEAKVGDYLLIAGCGAYDMSMQYNFGDGVVRTENVIVL